MQALSRPLLRASQLARCHASTSVLPVVAARRPPQSQHHRAPPPTARHASYYAEPGAPAPKKGIRYGTLFAVFALVGISATAVGLYQFFDSLLAYPKPIRVLLRKALRAALNKEFERASVAFEQAFVLAQQSEELGDHKVEKLSGIKAKEGEMWELALEPGRAVEAYVKAWDVVKAAIDQPESQVTERERMRGVNIAVRIGDVLLSSSSSGAAELEQAKVYLEWAVEEMLRLSMTPAQLEKLAIAKEHGSVPAVQGTSKDEEVQEQLRLPPWFGELELSSALERLGTLYSRTGQAEYAIPLYTQAVISLLPPPSPSNPRPADPGVRKRCHAATLMNNLSSSYVSLPRVGEEEVESASRWARQALTVATRARDQVDGELKKSGKTVAPPDREDWECSLVSAVASLNMGLLSEMAGDKKSAIAWLKKSRVQATAVGSPDGARRATMELRRIEGAAAP